MSHSKWSHGYWLLILLLMSGVVPLAPLMPASAQSPKSFTITFDAMDYADRTLIGPESSVRYYFVPPEYWALTPESYVELNVDYTVGALDLPLISTLQVILNDTVLHTEKLSTSSLVTLQIPISQAALDQLAEHTTQTLELVFTVPQDCEEAILKSLVIKSSSLFHFVYEEIPLRLELADYPAPIYQSQSFDQGAVRFILPAQPTAADLNAAAMIAARLGQLSALQLPMEVTLASELRSYTQFDDHLILIGQPENLPLLHELDLPVPLVEQPAALPDDIPETSTADPGELSNPYVFAVDGVEISPDYGIVQAAISPWNANRAALVVTGLTETAVLRAAQAISTEQQSPGIWGDYAIVQDTYPLADTVSFPTGDTAFTALGYDNETITLTLANFDVNFIIPPGRELDQDSYLSLHFSHSSAFNALDSTLEVSLNGVSIGSVRLDDTNLTDHWAQFPLPPVVTQAGANRLRLSVNSDTEELCHYYMNDRYWLTVFSDSLLHFNYRAKDTTLDLSQYPYPLNNQATLQNIVFVVSPAPTVTEIAGIITLAAQLGSATDGPGFAPQVILGSAASVASEAEMDAWADYDQIVIGLPTENAYLAVLNDDLPQRFQPGTNQVIQELDFSIYQLSPDMSLGYVQLLPAPADPTHTILVITGTTHEGIGWVVDALLDADLQAQLAGNLVLIREREVRSIDTRGESAQETSSNSQPTTIPTAISPMLPTATITAQSPMFTTPRAPTNAPATIAVTSSPLTPAVLAYETSTSEYEHPTWLIALLIASVVVIAIAVTIVVLQMRH
ncbi:MAG: cellulose biosynthesis cyclic di-GMP-binding regulatory protein BcsB [Anaerolineae bacterium]|nr:cellulose biosynthesis cyclic di-GMP-binding regulatory protein BcsB [Anaerolineae bacterium]